MGMMTFNNSRRRHAQLNKKNLDELNIKELHEIAKEKGLKRYSKLAKEVLIEYIKTGEIPVDEETEK